jgi:hypothetical protein
MSPRKTVDDVPVRDGNHRVTDAAREVAEHASTLTRLEIELAQIELKRKITSLGMGIGFGAAAAGLAALFVIFVFETIAAALWLVLPLWASLLIVAGILLLLALIAAFTARALVRRATPPVPETAIREAKLTSEAIRR